VKGVVFLDETKQWLTCIVIESLGKKKKKKKKKVQKKGWVKISFILELTVQPDQSTIDVCIHGATRL
jgi:hypothetical protein